MGSLSYRFWCYGITVVFDAMGSLSYLMLWDHRAIVFGAMRPLSYRIWCYVRITELLYVWDHRWAIVSGAVGSLSRLSYLTMGSLRYLMLWDHWAIVFDAVGSLSRLSYLTMGSLRYLMLWDHWAIVFDAVGSTRAIVFDAVGSLSYLMQWDRWAIVLIWCRGYEIPSPHQLVITWTNISMGCFDAERRLKRWVYRCSNRTARAGLLNSVGRGWKYAHSTWVCLRHNCMACLVL